MGYCWQARPAHLSGATFDLPDSVATHGQEATHSKWLASFQRLRSKLLRQLVQEFTTAVFEAVCERVFGSTLALQT
jgi:tRNA splicing ligase